MALIEQQSQDANPQKRLRLVHEVQRKLEEAAPRPMMGWRIHHWALPPYVKNLVAHNSIHDFGRMQEVWLAR